MILAMFVACLSIVVGPADDHGEGPAGSYQHVVDLVLGAPVAGEPRHKVAPWMLEASTGNHKAVGQCKMVAVSTPRTKSKLAQDVPCCHVHGAGSCIPILCNNQHVSYESSVDVILKVIKNESFTSSSVSRVGA